MISSETYKFMLKHFGIRDIWIVIKKNIYVIIGFMILSSLFFGLKAYNLINKNSSNNTNCFYISSSSYYVKVKTEIINQQKYDSYRLLPDDYIALLSTDSCIKYIYNGLTNIYSKEFISLNSDVKLKNESTEFDFNSFSNLYKAEREKNSMVFNICTLSYNKELSDSILNLLCEYLEKHIDNTIETADLKFLGRTNTIVDSSEETTETSDKYKVLNNNSNSSYTKIIIKNFVLPVMMLNTFIIFIFILSAFFNPTMNRKSDFCEYDIPILCEIK